MSTRVLAVTVLLVCLASGLYAQNNVLGIGARGGLNLASQSGGEGEGWTSSGLTTFGAGLLVEYYLDKNFALELDILYNMKGAKYEYSDPVNFPGFVFKETDEIGYLSIPLFARYAVVNEDAFQVYLMAGPEISFLMSAKWKDEATGEETDFKDELKSTEFSLDFGAGASLPVSTFKIIADVRYGLGLTSIHKEGEESISNNVIYVNLGVVFPISLN